MDVTSCLRHCIFHSWWCWRSSWYVLCIHMLVIERGRCWARGKLQRDISTSRVFASHSFVTDEDPRSWNIVTDEDPRGRNISHFNPLCYVIAHNAPVRWIMYAYLPHTRASATSSIANDAIPLPYLLLSLPHMPALMYDVQSVCTLCKQDYHTGP